VIKQPLLLSHNELIFRGKMGWLIKAGQETNRNVAIPAFIKLCDSDP
jgi:hypothetical protein